MAIIGATTLFVVVGGLLAFLGQRSKNAALPEPSLAQSTIPAAMPTVQPVVPALSPIPQPSAEEVVEPMDSAAALPSETAAKPQAKTVKPVVSATKKRARDLGY